MTFPLVSVATTVIVFVPTFRVPVANEVVHATGVPLLRRQVCAAIATLSLRVIVAVWLAVELVGDVRPLIAMLGAVWSTTIVAVWVVELPLVSVAMTVIVCDPAVSAPVAKEVVHGVFAPLSSLQVCVAIAMLSLATIVAVWLADELVGLVRPLIETLGAV